MGTAKAQTLNEAVAEHGAATVIAWAINSGIAKPKSTQAFVQENGLLRVTARSCADAAIAITDASRSLGLNARTEIERWEFRLRGQQEVDTHVFFSSQYTPENPDAARRLAEDYAAGTVNVAPDFASFARSMGWCD